MCALGQVLRLSIACLYGVVGSGWALSEPLAQKGNSYHFISYRVGARDEGYRNCLYLYSQDFIPLRRVAT